MVDPHLAVRLLRTVPTIVTVHMFFASHDTRVSYGWWLLIFLGIFLHGLNVFGDSRT